MEENVSPNEASKESVLTAVRVVHGHSDTGSSDNLPPPVDYLNDELASAYFEFRECEAFYRSLPCAEERRDFHGDLSRVLVRLLALAERDGVAILNELLERVYRDKLREAAEAADRVPADKREAAAEAFRDRLTERVRRIEPEGLRILGNEAVRGLEDLRAAYRAAALRCHPDVGGSCREMSAVNNAFGLLHDILVEEAEESRPSRQESADLGNKDQINDFPHYWRPQVREWSTDARAYVWAARALLLQIALDDWALDEAALHLEILFADKEVCAESNGNPLIALWSSADMLTIRLCAIGSVEKARSSLGVVLAARELITARGLSGFGSSDKYSEEMVAGLRRRGFILNHATQAENAFRLGAINQKRYLATLRRLSKKREDRSALLAALPQITFVEALPVDGNLTPSTKTGRLVPWPPWSNPRAETLTPDQQAEYLTAFRDAGNWELVAKYARVRQSSLLRSAIYSVSCCDLKAFLAEIQVLAIIAPHRPHTWIAKGAEDILRVLSVQGRDQREAFASGLAKLLGPNAVSCAIELDYRFFERARELATNFR